MEFVAVKAVDNSLRPVSVIDADRLKGIKVGQAVKIQVTSNKTKRPQPAPSPFILWRLTAFCF
ncbi:DUF1367 family protein [Snodgrassella alvi]|uniref:DUF1367 family protein n=1 Tax=Snodgrassella alvi TaxID=1196083 RepID=UPI000996C8A1|nr:DUF1367 family protein [Snodgrassella alvi]ORF02155.1 hypothetical protein BGH95_05725 [Snodgrassella alvi]